MRSICIAVLVVGTILVPSSADAGTLQVVYSRTGHTLAIFADVDEIFTVQDRNKDGRASVAQYKLGSLSTSKVGAVWNPNGAGSIVTYNASYAEGTVVYLRACEGNHDARSILTSTL